MVGRSTLMSGFRTSPVRHLSAVHTSRLCRLIGQLGEACQPNCREVQLRDKATGETSAIIEIPLLDHVGGGGQPEILHSIVAIFCPHTFTTCLPTRLERVLKYPEEIWSLITPRHEPQHSLPRLGLATDRSDPSLHSTH